MFCLHPQLPSYPQLPSLCLISILGDVWLLSSCLHFALTSHWWSVGHHGNIHLFSLAPANVRAP